LTTSWRNRTAVANERDMLAAGKVNELFEQNMDEVLRIARDQPDIPDTYYDEAVLQAWETFIQQQATTPPPLFYSPR
ncbi:MAG TPA: hypothetical protein P5307_19020, partial [Pirellulaceae bacterium]|nr:hypothetical protein [Pirellulaceae bacterium]